MLALAVLMWSLATLLTPSAAKLGVTSLIAARVTMGLGEGPAFPAIHSMIARSVPKASQSTAVGVVTAASYFGTAAAFASCPYLMTQGDGSWESVFYVFGGLGLLFLPAWLVLTREPLLPAVPDHINEEAVVQDALPTVVDVRDLVANHKEIQAIVIAQYTQRCVCVKAELTSMTYSCMNLMVTSFCLVQLASVWGWQPAAVLYFSRIRGQGGGPGRIYCPSLFAARGSGAFSWSDCRCMDCRRNERSKMPTGHAGSRDDHTRLCARCDCYAGTLGRGRSGVAHNRHGCVGLDLSRRVCQSPGHCASKSWCCLWYRQHGGDCGRIHQRRILRLA